jgi:hypothetical protein
MKMAVFWVVVPCSPVEVYQRFRGVYMVAGRKVKTAGKNNPTQHLLNFIIYFVFPDFE